MRPSHRLHVADAVAQPALDAADDLELCSFANGQVRVPLACGLGDDGGARLKDIGNEVVQLTLGQQLLHALGRDP